MAILVNGAGASAADPILSGGLGIALIAGCSSFDVSQVNNAFVDSAAGFPGTSTVLANLSPTAATVPAGIANGGYNDTSKQFDIGDSTGVAAVDYIFLSHPSITDGFYEVLAVPNGTSVTVVGNPLDTAGNQTNVSFQIAWTYHTNTGAAPISSSAGGDQNFWKFDAEDAGANNTQIQDSFFVRDAPAGADFVELDSGDFTGQGLGDGLLTLNILRSWANSGGVSHVELAAHSGQAVNNFTWQTIGGTAEQTLAVAETNGLQSDAGDGAKYGRLLLKSKAGGLEVGVDFDITVDSSGPSLQVIAAGL